MDPLSKIWTPLSDQRYWVYSVYCRTYIYLASVYKMALLSSIVSFPNSGKKPRRQNNQTKTLFWTWLSANMLSISVEWYISWGYNLKTGRELWEKESQDRKWRCVCGEKGRVTSKTKTEQMVIVNSCHSDPTSGHFGPTDQDMHERELLNDSTGKERWQVYKKFWIWPHDDGDTVRLDLDAWLTIYIM